MPKILLGSIQITLGIIMGIASLYFFIEVLCKDFYSLFAVGLVGVMLYFIINLIITIILIIKTKYKIFAITYLIVSSVMFIIIALTFSSGKTNIF
jgi:hypothetical protein